MKAKNSRSILIIDDDKDIRQCLRDVFSALHLACLIAADCEQGLKVLKKRNLNVSLILLDLTMSGMGTADFMSHLRGIPGYERVPVVAMSATSDRSPIAEFPEICGFIAKPFDFELLLRTVTNQGQKANLFGAE